MKMKNKMTLQKNIKNNWSKTLYETVLIFNIQKNVFEHRF